MSKQDRVKAFGLQNRDENYIMATQYITIRTMKICSVAFICGIEPNG